MTVASPRPRPARQGPTDFTLPVTRADVEAIQRTTGGPHWLSADRQVGFDAFEALPAESNRLYTPYIDLRGAHLGSARLTVAPLADRVPAALPRDTDGLLVLTEGDLTASVLSDDAGAAGVEFTTIGELLVRKPERVREAVGGVAPPGRRSLRAADPGDLDPGGGARHPGRGAPGPPIVVRWAAGALTTHS
jgi:hypothetical protein